MIDNIQIIKLDFTTSTIDECVFRIKNNTSENCAVIAKIQTDGRGKYGNKWLSVAGNLHMSVMFCVSDFYLRSKTDVLDRDFSSNLAEIVANIILKLSPNLEVFVKSNDVFIKNKKVCGVLFNLFEYDCINYFIFSFGLNIKSTPVFDNMLYNGTCIMEHGIKNDTSEISYLIIDECKKYLRRILKSARD